MHYLLQSYNYNLTDPQSIPNLFLKHLTIVGITMLISLIIAIPVGINCHWTVLTPSGPNRFFAANSGIAIFVALSSTPPSVTAPAVQ